MILESVQNIQPRRNAVIVLYIAEKSSIIANQLMYFVSLCLLALTVARASPETVIDGDIWLTDAQVGLPILQTNYKKSYF
jgi:positive regulator of sigma E activity